MEILIGFYPAHWKNEHEWPIILIPKINVIMEKLPRQLAGQFKQHISLNDGIV
jgi:hypothetical protein